MDQFFSSLQHRCNLHFVWKNCEAEVKKRARVRGDSHGWRWNLEPGHVAHGAHCTPAVLYSPTVCTADVLPPPRTPTALVVAVAAAHKQD